MKTAWGFLQNLFLILLALYIFTIAETSLALSIEQSVFHWLPTPMTWAPFLLYLSLFRKPLEGICSIYFMLLALSVFTIAPIGQLLLAGLGLFLTTQLVKSHVFTPDSRYFLVLTIIATFVLLFTFWLGQMIYGSTEMRFPKILTWSFQALITSVPGYIIFFILRWIDHITKKPILTEASLEASRT